jgi:hypothetical protein
MHSEIPLDDRIGRTFYVGGSLWKYLYDTGKHRFAMRRTVSDVPLSLALDLIASGEVLWSPPARFARLGAKDSLDSVRHRVALLEAFRQSPACVESTDWMMRTRIDAQLVVLRQWLNRQALPSGEDGG